MFSYLLPLAFGFAAALTGVAQAQDYSAGKTPAQLFASDCSACHKSPQGLAKGTDTRSLASFLREHYTTKPESAGALAAFVAGAGAGPAAAEAKPKPGTAREKPEPAAAASAKPRRPEPAGEGEQAARPAPKPRSAAVGSEPKPGEEQKPIPRRQPAAPRTASPGDGGRPEVDDGAKPAANAEPKPGSRTRGAKPAATAKHDGEKPVQATRPDGKLDSYTSSGEPAKPMETEATVDSDRRLQSYATSGGGVAAISGETVKPAAPSNAAQQVPVPQAEPAAADAAKPAAMSADETKPAASVGGPPRNRPRRAAAPVGGDTDR